MLIVINGQPLTAEKVLYFNLSYDPVYELPVMLILATGLHFIWENRVAKKSTSLYQVRAEIECMVSLLRRSRSKRLREAGKMVENTMTNFSINC